MSLCHDHQRHQRIQRIRLPRQRMNSEFRGLLSVACAWQTCTDSATIAMIDAASAQLPLANARFSFAGNVI